MTRFSCKIQVQEGVISGAWLFFAWKVSIVVSKCMYMYRYYKTSFHYLLIPW